MFFSYLLRREATHAIITKQLETPTGEIGIRMPKNPDRFSSIGMIRYRQPVHVQLHVYLRTYISQVHACVYMCIYLIYMQQLGLQSCKKKEEEIHVRTDGCRESKQGTQANTNFISRAKRRDKSGKSHPRRAATHDQPRDTLLDSTSTRDKRASVSAKKTKTKATGSQAKVTSSQTPLMSSQNTVTSSRRSAESKWDGTGAKRQRESSTSELWFDDVDMEVVRGEPVPKRQRVSLTTGSDSR